MLRTWVGPLLGAVLLAGCGAQAIQSAPAGAGAPTARMCMAEIKILRLSDMSVRAITAPDQPASDPAWSPDGRTLVFASDRGGASQLYTVGADGAGEARLPTDANDASDPAWSPDGRSILYASDEVASGNRVVRLLTADGDQDSLALNVANPLGYHGQDHGLPAWAPDGERFLAVYAFRGNLWFDLTVWAGSDDPAPAAIYSGGSAVDGADWAPDGERIVFARNGMLVIAPAVAGGADAALDTGIAGYNPSWSPDGQQIAFDTGCRP